MQNPLVWLGLSLLLVAVCLTAVLLMALPVMQELARAARSAEKLLDMLSQELPPTLRSLRATGEELSQLSEQVNEGVRGASQVVKQVDEGLETVRHKAATASRQGLSLAAGLREAWRVFWRSPAPSPASVPATETPLSSELAAQAQALENLEAERDRIQLALEQLQHQGEPLPQNPIAQDNCAPD